MNQREIIEKYYNLLVLYSDFVEHGFRKDHKIPDLSALDNLEKVNEAIDSPKKAIKQKMGDRVKEKVTNDKNSRFTEINKNILNCTRCNLHINSKKIQGIGRADAKILVLSLPPMTDEEKNETPLSLKSLEFFKKWIEAINLNLSDLFITNLLKCPPKKNPVTKENIESCRYFFDKQIEILEPQVIITLGQLALSVCKKRFVDLNRSHGELFYYNDIPVIPTFHPSEVLSNASFKKVVWEDLKKLKAFLSKKGA